jgi:hypothetical protein
MDNTLAGDLAGRLDGDLEELGSGGGVAALDGGANLLRGRTHRAPPVAVALGADFGLEDALLGLLLVGHCELRR